VSGIRRENWRGTVASDRPEPQTGAVDQSQPPETLTDTDLPVIAKIDPD
jgi:hypothetical protein